MKRVVWAVLLLGIVGAGVMSLRSRPLEVEMGRPELRLVREFIADEAKTRLEDEYLVDTPIAGTVERITWDVGDHVEQGEVLARIDSFDLEQRVKGVQAMIMQAKARIAGVDVAKPKAEDKTSAAVRVKEFTDALRISERERAIAQIDYNESKKNYERAIKLVEEGVVSQSVLDDAEWQFKALEQQVERTKLAEGAARKGLEQAELAAQRLLGSVDDNEYQRDMHLAEIESLEAQLEILRGDLEKTVVRAPVSGPILEKYVDNRRVLPAGTPLLKIGDLSTIEIECDVLSEEVGRVEADCPVDIIGKAVQGKSVTGSVKRIYPSAFTKISSLGIEQQRVKTIIAFDNSKLKLLPGTRLDVRIVTAESPGALAVPERATFRQDNVWYVFTVRNGQAHQTPIRIGLKNDEWAEIIEGLSTEDTIINEPTNELEDGKHVTPRAF